MNAIETVCSENKIAFENISLSGTIIRRVEEINNDLRTQTIRSRLRILLYSTG